MIYQIAQLQEGEQARAPEQTREESQTQTLSGTVTDPSGAVVPGATAMLVPAASGATAAPESTTQSGAAGEYRLRAAPGTYKLVVLAAGFARFESANIRLGEDPVGKRRLRRLDAQLQLEVLNERVDVRGEFGGESDRGGNAIVLSRRDIEAMPLDPTALLDELQGLAGSRDAELFVDGFSGAKLPPRGSIREVRINQNPYSAQNDTNPVNGVIEVLTKPGTGAIHGQFYLYGVDSAVDAGNPFAQNQPGYYADSSGGDISGPLNRRASYFASWDQTDLRLNSAIDAQTLDANRQPVQLNYAVPSPHTTLDLSSKLDLRTSANGTMMFRYVFDRDHQSNGGLAQLALASQAFDNITETQTLQITNSQVLGAKMVNETRFQYLRTRTAQTPVSPAPAIVVEGAFTGGGSDLGAFNDHLDRFELQNYLTRAQGSHYLNFGARLRVGRDANYSLANFSGQFIFPSLSAYAAQTPTEFNQNAGNPRTEVALADVGAFAQDDWRFKPNLTLSYGLRFESQTYIHDHADWAPRAGFSWGLDAHGTNAAPKYVLHGGAGIFYRRFLIDSALQAERLNGATQQEYVVTSPGFYPSVPGMAQLGTPTPTIYRVSPTFHAPYFIGTSLALDRKFGKHGTASLTYQNNRGVHAQLTENVNAPLPGTFNPAVPGSGVRPLGYVQNIYEYVSAGVYRSNRLSANIVLHAGDRLTVFGNYMLRYDKSDADGASGFPSNQYDLGADYSRSLNDVRHSASLGDNASLPFGVHTSGYLRVTSGAPFNIVLGQDLNGDTEYNDRPALATDLSRPTVVATRFGAFDTSPIAGQTIIPRNYGQGPGSFLVNFALGKIFRLGPDAKAGATNATASTLSPLRKGTLDLWIEAQNVLNHPNLLPPVGTLNSPLFGRSVGLMSANILSPDRVLVFQTQLRF